MTANYPYDPPVNELTPGNINKHLTYDELKIHPENGKIRLVTWEQQNQIIDTLLALKEWKEEMTKKLEVIEAAIESLQWKIS